MPALTAIEKVLELEKTYWDAVKNKDGDTTARLTDDKCVVVGTQGVSEFNPEAIGSMTRAMQFELDDYRIDDPSVIRLGNNVMIVAYRVTEDLGGDGSRSSMEAFESSVWVKRDDGWRCALHTETPAANGS